MSSISAHLYVTLCTYKKWPHAALITTTPDVLNTINNQLFDENILDFEFEYTALTDKQMPYVVTKLSDPHHEDLSRSDTIQMIKRHCPPTAHDALATLISTDPQRKQYSMVFGASCVNM